MEAESLTSQEAKLKGIVNMAFVQALCGRGAA
jgi:hypothetical protein